MKYVSIQIRYCLLLLLMLQISGCDYSNKQSKTIEEAFLIFKKERLSNFEIEDLSYFLVISSSRCQNALPIVEYFLKNQDNNKALYLVIDGKHNLNSTYASRLSNSSNVFIDYKREIGRIHKKMPNSALFVINRNKITQYEDLTGKTNIDLSVL